MRIFRRFKTVFVKTGHFGNIGVQKPNLQRYCVRNANKRNLPPNPDDAEEPFPAEKSEPYPNGLICLERVGSGCLTLLLRLLGWDVLKDSGTDPTEAIIRVGTQSFSAI